MELEWDEAEEPGLECQWPEEAGSRESGGWRAEHGQDTKDSASAPWRIAELGLSRDSGGPGPSLEDCLCHKGHPIMP